VPGPIVPAPIDLETILPLQEQSVTRKKSGDIRVAFILGYTRSGSTLLEQLLSMAPGTVAVGEMAYLWEQSVRNNSYCGCGSKWPRCPFWKSILEAQPSLDFQKGRSPDAPQFWAFFGDLVYRGRSSNNQHYKRFLNQIESIYRAIKHQTRCSMIIDSSKRPIFGLAVSRIQGVSVTFIHLVRDSRGCAFSWKKAKARMELGKNAFMSHHPAHRSALAWIGNNLQAEILRTQRCQNIFLRYEDLVANPAFEVNKILSQVGLPSILSDQNGIFHAPISHGIWGNPDRWSNMNAIKVTQNERWVTELSKLDFAVTTLISAPLLKWYGYPFFHSRRRQSS
jgi:Sulfotransferase domain